MTKVLRVHLVHGTWPKGLLGNSEKWPGEAVRQNLTKVLPADAKVETFEWTGRNSVVDRDKAAESFRLYLRERLDLNPADRHVVVAHSHGGTIASHAISHSDLDGRIQALICLATPFVYLAAPSFKRFGAAMLALASVASAIVWTLTLAIQPSLPRILGDLGLTGAALLMQSIAVFIVVLVAVSRRVRVVPEPPSGPAHTPIHLLRATRDEASMILAMAQIFDQCFASVAIAHDHLSARRRLSLPYARHLIAYVLCLSIALKLERIIFPDHMFLADGYAVAALAVAVYSPAIAGLIYLLGYALLALSAGHWSILRWLSTVIEVDAVPPNTTCSIRVFSSLDAPGLRHSLYKDARVLECIGGIVRSG